MRSRLLAYYIALFAAAMIALGAVLVWWLNGFYLDQLSHGLETGARVLDAGGEAPSYRGARVTVIGRDGTVLFDSHRHPDLMENHAERPEVRAAFAGQTARSVRYSPTLGVEMLYVAVPRTDGGVVRLAVQLTEVRDEQRRLAVVVFGAAAGVSILAIAGLFWVLRATVAPLDRLTDAAHAMSQGDLGRRAPEGGDDFGRLGATLNQMAHALSTRLTELAESRDRLSAVVTHMASGVLLVDGVGRLVLANKAALELTGMEPGDLGRNHVLALRHYDLSSAITTALQTGRESQLELTVHRATVEAVLVPVQGKGVVVVLHDVTERRRVEQMRRDFVANVSHELRTPVTAVQGFAATLLGGALDEPETRTQFVEIIHKESLRMSALIADLLDLAKLEAEPGAVKPVLSEIGPLVEGIVARMQPRAGEQGVALTASVEPVTAEVDPVRLEQVLVNLLDNSLKHTPSGGSIAIRIRQDASHLVGQVEDTGAGIPAGALSRIFERFYRVDPGRSRKVGGTGLGLAIVKHIVEAHGGHVAVWSKVGEGTVITFSVPLRQGR